MRSLHLLTNEQGMPYAGILVASVKIDSLGGHEMIINHFAFCVLKILVFLVRIINCLTGILQCL